MKSLLGRNWTGRLLMLGFVGVTGGFVYVAANLFGAIGLPSFSADASVPEASVVVDAGVEAQSWELLCEACKSLRTAEEREDAAWHAWVYEEMVLAGLEADLSALETIRDRERARARERDGGR